jgi:hypothetical protein
LSLKSPKRKRTKNEELHSKQKINNTVHKERKTLVLVLASIIFNHMPFSEQPLYKGQLQRLLLNLCAHRETRASLVQILVDMLMLDLQVSTSKPNSLVEPPFRLYGCQSSITYSRPQHSDGKLVSAFVLIWDKVKRKEGNEFSMFQVGFQKH